MSANADLGTLSTGVGVDLSGLRAARQQLVSEVTAMSRSMETMATEAEKAGQRAEDALKRAAASKSLREAARAAKEAAREQAAAAKMQADAVETAAKREAAAIEAAGRREVAVYANRRAALADLSRGAMVAGGAVAAALGLAYNAAAKFDQAMRNTNSLAKLNETQFKQLKSSVMSIVDDSKIRQGPTDLAKGLYDIYGSGFAGQKALDVLKVSAVGASAGMTDTATSARVLMAVLNSGIEGADDAKTAMDILFKEVDLGVNTFEQLAGSIGLVLPTAKLMGVSLQEVAAALATMTRQGLSAEESATALNNLMLHIAKPSEAAAKEMKSLGIEYGATALQTKGLVGWLDEAIKKTDGNKDKLIALIPELRGMKGELILAADKGKLYKEQLEGMAHAADGAGASAKANAEQMKGASAQFEVAKKNVEMLAIELGEHLLPEINKVLGGAVDLMREFHKLPEETKGSIVKFALGAAVFATVAGMVGNLILKIGRLKEVMAGLSFPKLPAGIPTGGPVGAPVNAGARAAMSGSGLFGSAETAFFGSAATVVGNATSVAAAPLLTATGIGLLGVGIDTATANRSQQATELPTAQRIKYLQGQKTTLQTRIDKARSAKAGTSDGYVASLQADPPSVGPMLKEMGVYQREIDVLTAQMGREKRNTSTRKTTTEADKALAALDNALLSGPPAKSGSASGKGDKETKEQREARQKAERLANSHDRAEETRADNLVTEALDVYDKLLSDYQKNGGVKNIPRIREMSRIVAQRKVRAAEVRLSHATAEDKPNAKAEFTAATSPGIDLKTGAIIGSIPREAAARQQAIDDAQTAREKKAAEEATKKAKEKEEAEKKAAKQQSDATDAELDDKKALQDQSDRFIEGIIRQTEIDLSNGEITRTAARDRFTELLTWLDRTDAKFGEVTGKVRELNVSLAEHGENERDVNAPGSPDAEGVPDGSTEQTLPGGAVLTQAPDLAKPKDTNPFKYIGDSMAQNLDFANQHWHSFNEGFNSTLGSMKQAFIKAVAEMIAKWATMKIGSSLGALGGPVGSLVGAGAGSLLGGLFGGHRANGGPMSAGRAYAVAEAGTGGELIIPQVNSLAVPMKALMNGGGSGSGGRVSSYKGGSVTTNQIDVHVQTGDINHPLDVQGLGDTLGWAVNAALPTTRGED